MPDIRYVVLSDMHLGAENSILTNLVPGTYETDTSKPSPVLSKLVECLRDIISRNEGSQKPTLILNGDLMELALTSTNNASMAFERFAELIMPEDGEPLFDKKIYFLSGNHDHNLWERSRGYKYIEYLKCLKEDEPIRNERHTTSMFIPDEVIENLLTVLIQRNAHLSDVTVNAVYPAHAVLSDDKQKCVIFCHGHYVESMYSLMTSLNATIFPDREPPQTLEDLETQNYAWVDFFWSTLGRSGSVGKDISLIYDKIQDPEEVKVLINNIAKSFTKSQKNIVMRWIEKEVMEEILELTVGRLASSERSEPDVALTPDATAGLKKLMEVFIMSQFKTELNGVVPPNVSFIFGHTHKPFQKAMDFEGYANPVNVYNSGGWVVDTMNPQPLHGGSVVLVDEHMDVVSVHFYKEGNSSVTIEEIEDANQKDCVFYDRIKDMIDMSKEPWAGFSAVAAKEVELRHKNLALIAKSND